MTERIILVRAHAKVNLALRILGRRPDGYHELWTVFQSLALHDTLACAACDGPFRLECDEPGVPGDERNLVWRAATAVWRAAGREGAPRGAVVRLKKRIPVQAGLGGGSSDAAAALIMLRDLWGAQLADETLMTLAASLGADVPFFLSGGTAMGTGRGDRIRPLADMPHHWVVLLTPPFGISTQEAFFWWDGWQPAGREAAVPGGAAPEWRADSPVVNDLELAVAARHPEIARMTSALRGAGARAAAMTGSGSTVFGLFDDPRTARQAAASLHGTSWRVVLTRFADADSCARARRPRRRQVGAPPRS